MSVYTDSNPEFLHIEGIRYALKQEIVWHIGSKNGPEYRVPKGFIFDVSVPKWAWLFFSPNEMRYFKAAALHDHMLIEGWDRMTSGSQFHQALKADGVSALKRIVMWIAVSLYKYK